MFMEVNIGIPPMNVRKEGCHGRIVEQITVKPVLHSPGAAVDDAFDKMASADGLEAIRNFVVDVSGWVLRRSELLLADVHRLYDAHTGRALESISREMTVKLRRLKEAGWRSTGDQSDWPGNPSAVMWSPGNLRPFCLDEPRRPPQLHQDDRVILNEPIPKLLESREGITRLIHFIVADIEICAAEICARNIAEYSHEMPIAFIKDMARQCSDEARHARMAMGVMESYGVSLGDFTYTNAVWTNCLKGQSLAERLAIEQIVAEGNGLDGSMVSLKAMRAMGMDDFAEMYEFLLADETVHCDIGNRWVAYLSLGDRAKFEETIELALQRTGLSLPGSAPVAEDIRRAAGFPEWFLQERLLQSSKAIGDGQ
jgi:uncharacterized ferritin-like protein (DUF455 family)